LPASRPTLALNALRSYWLADCKPIIDATTYKDMERLFCVGVLAKCNTHSTEENVHTYLRYGNHKSTDTNPAAIRKV
jgi:hypothetical protein